ncbi:MAG: carboxypeptidase regulatory-like domain-containing protein [Planctomycetota bacterium]|jgi:beta-lactamase regulating signal transducer with metallopeptidase domain/5-hydroxyisourate hydrolase-like protein (transthyretin family)
MVDTGAWGIPPVWTAVGQATLFLFVGLLIAGLLRRRPARAHAVLALAAAAALVAPFFSVTVRQMDWGILPPSPTTHASAPAPQQPSVLPAVIGEPEAASVGRLGVDPPAGTKSAAPAPVPRSTVPRAASSDNSTTGAVVAAAREKSTVVSWNTFLIAAWVCLSGVVLLRLLLSLRRARQLLAGASPVTDSAMQRALEEAAEKLGLRGAPSLRTSPDVRFPVIWCWGVRPVLLTPDHACRSSADVDWMSVFCHELAHFERRDHLTGMLGELLTAVLPWHPLAWWAKRRLAQLSEQACDDRVLAAGRPATGYAESLLSLRAQDRPSLALAAVTSRKSLARRLVRILSARRSHPTAGLGWTLTATLVTATLATAMALAQPRSEAVAEPPDRAESVESAPIQASPPHPKEKPAPEGTVVFAGQVVDPDEKPVPGVQVRSDVTVYRPRRDVKLGEARTTTDEEGRFELTGLAELDSGSRTLIFEHPEYAIAWLSLSRYRENDPTQIRMALVRPAAVGGLVTDEQGQPVAGATIEAAIDFPREGAYGFSREGAYGRLYLSPANNMAAATDAQGRFVFEKIPEGARLDLTVRHPSYVTFRTRGRRGGFSPAPFEAGDRDVRVRLSPGGVIQGRLVRGEKPVAWENVKVSAALPETSGVASYTRTDAEGRFVLTGLAGGQYVVFADKNYLPDDEVVCAPVPDVRVEVGEAPVEVDLVCTEGRVLTGRVLDEQTGRPVSDQYVTARLGANFSIRVDQTITDAEGRYRLRLPLGEYQLIVGGWRNGRPHSVRADVTIPRRADLPEVDLRVGVRPQLTGRLVDEEGRPVEGKISLDSESAETAKDGSFAVPEPFGFPNVAGLPYGFAFSRDKKLAAGFPLSRFEPGTEQRIVLKRPAEVRGVVVDVTGVPIPGASAGLHIITGDRSTAVLGKPPWQRHVDPNGAFAFSGVPVGIPLRLLAGKRGYESNDEKLTDLQPGEVRDLVVAVKRRMDVELVPPKLDATLAGRVVDENKRPVVGAGVSTGTPFRNPSDTTDQDGRFRLEGLPVGKTIRRLRVDDPDFGRRYFRDIHPGHDALELQVFPPGFDRIGKPAPEWHVAQWLQGGPLTLEQLRGKVVLLHVAVSIRAYQRSAPRAQALAEKHAGELVVIGIHRSLDPSPGRPLSETEMQTLKQRGMLITEAEIVQSLEDRGVTFPFAIDDGRTAALYGVERSSSGTVGDKAPFLIDKKGIVRYCPREADLGRRIAELLAE